jgi:5'-nucleotidase
MRILLSNDDGIEAPGLLALEAALQEWAEVITVAPSGERSAMSHAFTMHAPVAHERRGEGRVAVDGTPVDCVYLALHGLVPTVDLVVSGINRGANVGQDVHYSGTVGAAVEGALHGVPAMAVSLNILTGQEAHWATAVEATHAFLAAHPVATWPTATVMNLNVPNQAQEAKIRWTRLGRRAYAPMADLREGPRGRSYAWLGGPPLAQPDQPGTDVSAVEAGFSSITPLSLDWTDEATLRQMLSGTSIP